LLDTRAAAKADHLQPSRHDEAVADDFFNWPRHQSKESSQSPRLVGLLYGLLCVDFTGKEVLMPFSNGITDVRDHEPRIWFKTSTVTESTQVANTAMGIDGTGAYTYFDIASSRVAFKALNSAGNELPDPTAALKKRNNAQHPWMHIKWVRCLKQLTGISLITSSQRNDPALVASRIWLGTGTVAAVPPFSKDGQHNEWRVRQSNGKEVVSSTTDSMLWSRPLTAGTAKVRMTITPLAGGAGKNVELTPESGVLMCVATHATTMPHGDPTRLTDSKAFARILRNGDPSRYPVAVLDGLPKPAYALSSDDVHCECASCP